MQDVVEIPGGYIVPARDSHLGKWQQQAGRLVHDSFLPALACKFLRPGMTVIDAGAFDGDHTQAYSEAVGRMGRVIALEPAPLAFHCLEYNIRLFRDRNVTALPYALGASRSLGTSLERKPEDNLGMSAMSKEKGLTHIMTLDDVAKDVHVDFVKLDIEGWELEALKGAERLLHRDRPVWLIEVNQEALKAQAASADDIYSIMHQHNYAVLICEPECRKADPQYDVICCPGP